MVFIENAPALLINLPIIITIIAATRYIIGFKTWKNYPVLALALAFYFLAESGATSWTTIGIWALYLAGTILSTFAAKFAIKKQKVNYYSRIAILYIAATIATLITTLIISITSPNWAPLSTPAFAIAITLIASTTEEFASLHYKKDTQEFIRRLITTTILGLFSGILTVSPNWNSFLYNHQEVLLAVLAIDIIISSWTALRFTEFIRFNSIIRNQK